MIRLEDYLPLQYPGPVSRQRTLQLKLAWLQLAVIGFGIALFAPSSHLQSFGLGLIFPGAGFLHHAVGSAPTILLHLGLMVASLVVFLIALFIWFWNGNVILPAVVWILAAVAAGLMEHPGHDGMHGGSENGLVVSIFGTPIPIAPFIAVALAGLATVLFQRRVAKDRRTRTSSLDRRRAAIAHVVVPASPTNAAGSGRRVKELSPDDIAAMRFALDRALQPVNEWQGFYFGDQWQPAATRYQVNTMGWALALANHNSLPAMRSYLQQAQLNLIEKAKDHKLWWYWRWENLWGNLRWNSDPMPIDNIMYSGYLGMQIGMYQAATGDLRHDEPGAFTLQHPNGDRFVYDFPRITEIVARQFDADYCFWPCEPNMIYPSCNIYGAIGVAAYDAAHGTDNWARIEPRFRQQMRDEFTFVDGTVMTLKSKYTGLSLLGGSVASLFTVAAFVPALMPDVGAAQWAIAKSELFDTDDQRKRRRTRGRSSQPDFARDMLFPDPGNYKRNHAFILSCMLMSAGELGDNETYSLAQELRGELAPSEITDGVLRHPEASIWTNAHMMMGRFADANGFNDLVQRGSSRAWRDGPLLITATYPDVLVAKAVSDDGAGLDLVLYAGTAKTVQHIGIGQLRPNVHYRVCIGDAEVSTVRADAGGEAALSVDLRGRTCVSLTPTVVHEETK